ncbi:MAG: MFS transporter [Alphaproteobacteria bacterium]|tara:strand:+ start:1683 stop:2918 length:1236 start_codon:yes stop_codon:yes gene_type:complete
MSIKRIIHTATPELSLGVFLVFSSSIGQTFFISLFSGEIRSEFNISHGIFGIIYSAATLSSAIVFFWLGKLADQFNLTLLGLITLGVLSGFSFLISSAETLLMLFLSLLGLRLFGQSMISHISVTAMARWFSKKRGQALSIALMGHPIGEALLPFFFTFFLLEFTWREIWMGISICIIIFFLPLVFWLGRQLKSERFNSSVSNRPEPKNFAKVSWNRSQVLRDIRFYQIIPGLLASPFIVTGFFFHQIHLIETKSWSISLLGSSYPLFALSVTGVTFASGWIVDRFSTVHLLRIFLLPLALGLMLIASTDSVFAFPLFMILVGASTGSATIVISALWAELYGIGYLGSIRSMCFSMVVISTSISPALIGFLLDIGVTLEVQFIIFAIYVLVCSIGFAILTPNLLIARPPPS